MTKENKDIVEHASENSGDNKSETNHNSSNQSKSSSAGMIAFVILSIIISITVGAFGFHLFQKLEKSNDELNSLKLEIGGQLSGKLDNVTGKFTNVSDRFDTESKNVNERFLNISDRIGNFNTQISTINNELSQNKNTNTGIQASLGQLKKVIDDTRRSQKISNEQVTHSIDKLYKQRGKTRNDWILSEVEYLLLIANHGLNLSNDVNTAIIALESADSRLLDMGDPGIINVRKAIAEELIQLKAIPKNDIAGMQLTLSSIIKHVDLLKVLNSEIPSVKNLISEESKPVQTEVELSELSDFERFKVASIKATDKFVSELKTLVAFRHKKSSLSEIVAPEQKFFLQQYLTLKLETARKALIDGRNQMFHHLLEESLILIDKYFDKESESVKNTIAQIKSLQQVKLSPELPNISFSLKELKTYVRKIEEYRLSSSNSASNKLVKPAKGE